MFVFFIEINTLNSHVIICPLLWLDFCEILCTLVKYHSVSVGGRDRRGGPILTFPATNDVGDVSMEDLTSAVIYLCSIPRWDLGVRIPRGAEEKLWC